RLSLLVLSLSHTCRSFLFLLSNDTATTDIYTLSLHDALPICIDQLLLAGVERVALAANFDVDLRLGVTGVDHIAAGAGNRAVHVVRMDALLHGSFTSFSIMIPGAILDICAHHNLRIAATSIHHPVRMEQPSERLLKYRSAEH